MGEEKARMAFVCPSCQYLFIWVADDETHKENLEAFRRCDGIICTECDMFHEYDAYHHYVLGEPEETIKNK